MTVSGAVDDWALSVVPTTVLFYQGRLWYGDENKIVGSRTQTTNGTPRFDDFTMGSDADHAINLTNTIFKNPILWMKVVNNALIAGTSTQIYKIKCYNDPVVTTTNLPEITPISNEGSKNIIPLQEQNNIFYVSIIGTTNDNGSRLSAIKYDYLSEGYQVLNTNIYSDEINKEGIIQCAYVKGYDDILYCLKSNGEITGMNYNPDQQIMGLV